MFRIKFNDDNNNVLLVHEPGVFEKIINNEPVFEHQYKTFFESYEEAEARLKNALTINPDKQMSDFTIYEEGCD